MLPLLVLLGTIAGAWYLLIVRPQQQQQTRHGALVSQLQIGDHVLTVGGIFGRVVGVNGAMVDVELSGPGSVTRIATDAIARIVHGSSELTTPNANAEARPPVTHMQQHHNEHAAPHAPQPTTGGFVAPPLPAFGQQTYQPATQPTPAPMYAQQAPVAPAYGQTTLRAQVVDVAPLPPAPILTPWADVAPRQPLAPAQPVHAVHPNAAGAPAPISPGFQLAHQQAVVQHAPAQPQYAAQQYAPQVASAPVAPMSPPQYAMPHPPVQAHPSGPAAAYPPPHVAAGAAAIPSPQFAQSVAPQQPVHQQPVHAQPMVTTHAQPMVPAHAQPVAAPVAAERPVAEGRRRSRAPEGMGSSLRLDDPSLLDTMARARNERVGLADEYRRVVAPLVDISNEPAPQYAAPAPAAAHAAHAPAAPNRLFAHDAPQAPGAMPRPHVAAPSEQVDPALFQRRTPMAHQAAPQGFPFAEAPAPVAAPGVPA